MDLHGKNLLRGLSIRGHEVIVVSTAHPAGKTYESAEGVEYHYLQNTAFGSPRKGWARESLKFFRELQNKRGFDIVVSQGNAGYGVAKAARSLGIPVVAIMHGYEAMLLRSVFNQVLNFKKGWLTLLRSLLAFVYYWSFQEYPLLIHSSCIIAVSDVVAEVLAGKPLVKKDKIRVIHYGVDLDVFKVSPKARKEMRKRLAVSDGSKIVLYLSILSKQKGADVALRAFGLLSDMEDILLVMGGSGDYLEEAKDLARRLGIEKRVVFAGLIDNTLAADYYNAADVFIFPTLRVESFGIVLTEAMACGKPIIASRIGSIPEVIDDGINGILIPPGDYRQLAAQIRRLLTDKETASLLAKTARAKAVEKFGLDRMIDDTIRTCERALSGER